MLYGYYRAGHEPTNVFIPIVGLADAESYEYCVLALAVKILCIMVKIDWILRQGFGNREN